MHARLTLPNHTYEDYCQWQGDWELIQGIPYAMSPSPLPIHQVVLLEIIDILNVQLKTKNCKECRLFADLDWKVDEFTVVRPDIMLLCRKQNLQDIVVDAPTVIIEILSKSTLRHDRTTKYDLYEASGVRYYLMADPAKGNLVAFELKDGEYQAMPGPPFTLDIHPGCSLLLGQEGWGLT